MQRYTALFGTILAVALVAGVLTAAHVTLPPLPLSVALVAGIIATAAASSHRGY